MSEGGLLKDIRIATSKLGHRLFRCNSGRGWVGKSTVIREVRTVKLFPGDVVIRKARIFHAFPKGTSDLIGWSTVKVTQEMVGEDMAVFTALEAKTGKLKATTEQKNFINAVNNCGGIAGVVRSSDDSIKLINNYKGE